MEGKYAKFTIIEDFIQQMRNSGHKFQFIKSVVLQAITKHEYMLERDKLKPTSKRYCPMYRTRSHKQTERIMIKHVGALTWFTVENLDDPFKQGWKGRIRRKGLFSNRKENVCGQSKRVTNTAITTKMFIPPTPGSKLLKKLLKTENNFQENDRIEWGVKLIEKSGVSLINCLRIRYPIELGCPLGNECCVCNKDAINCTPRGVVYRASCTDCKQKEVDRRVVNYIGETSRPLRLRAMEHKKKLEALDENSFMLIHWADAHRTELEPPTFKFERVGTYRDPLSRQIAEALFIIKEGELNSKFEFGLNHICRLEASVSRKEEEIDRKKEKDRLSVIERNVIALKNVLLNNKFTALPSSNSSTTFRHLTKTKKERTQAEKREWEPGINRQEEEKEKEPGSRKRKKRKMESVLTSTPSFRTRQEQEETSRSPINVSPIKVFDLSRDVVDPEAYTSM